MSEGEYAPVYFGNTLKPTHAKNQPEVTFDANKKLVANQVMKYALDLSKLNFLLIHKSFAFCLLESAGW